MPIPPQPTAIVNAPLSRSRQFCPREGRTFPRYRVLSLMRWLLFNSSFMKAEDLAEAMLDRTPGHLVHARIGPEEYEFRFGARSVKLLDAPQGHRFLLVRGPRTMMISQHDVKFTGWPRIRPAVSVIARMQQRVIWLPVCPRRLQVISERLICGQHDKDEIVQSCDGIQIIHHFGNVLERSGFLRGNHASSPWNSRRHPGGE